MFLLNPVLYVFQPNLTGFKNPSGFFNSQLLFLSLQESNFNFLWRCFDKLSMTSLILTALPLASLAPRLEWSSFLNSEKKRERKV